MEIVQMAKDTFRSAKHKAKGLVLGTIYLRPKIFILTVTAVVLMGYKSVFAADYDLFYTKANIPLRNAFQSESSIELSKVGSGKILDFGMRTSGSYSSVSPFTVYNWNGKAYGWISGFGNYSEKYVVSASNYSPSSGTINYGCGTYNLKRMKGTVAVKGTFDFSNKNDLTTSLPSGGWEPAFSSACFGSPAHIENTSGPAFAYNGLNGNVTSISGKDYVVTGNVYADSLNLAEMPSGLFVKVRTPEAIKTAIVGAAGQGANNTFNLFPTTATAITAPFVGFVNTIIDGGDGKKCFPTVQAYTSTTSWKQISVVCHDFSLTEVGATTYNVGVDNSATRVSLIKGSTDSIADAKVAKCASGSVHTAPLSNLSVSTAPASNPAVWTNSGKPCSEVFVDKKGKDGVMESDFEVRDSDGVLIGTFPSLSYIGSTLNGYATNSTGGGTVYTNPLVAIPGFGLSAPPYNSCSANDVKYVRSFSPITLTGGVWTQESGFSKLSFSGGITLATNGSTGSTNPNSLSVGIPQNSGGFFEIWGNFDSAYVEFSQTGSIFFSDKPDPLNSPSWSLYGYLTPFKRFYTGRAPFEFVNSSNEILSLSKISVGSSKWEKRTTTTCVDSNGVITTTTSTGSYVPPESGSGIVFGTGGMPSIGPPETGNAVADGIIGVIYEKIGGTLDGIVGPISSMVATPFPDTPDLTLEIPRILLSGGTATAGMSMDVSKQQADFVVDRMDSITHGGTYKKPFEFVNLEDSGGPRNAISAALAVAYGALVLMAFWILLWPIYLAKSAGNLLSSRFDAPSSGGEITVLGVVARVAYYAALTALVGTLMTVWGAAVFSVFDVIISFSKAILTFLAVMFGSYPVFANIANLVPAVSIGGAVLVLVYRYAMGVRVSL